MATLYHGIDQSAHRAVDGLAEMDEAARRATVVLGWNEDGRLMLVPAEKTSSK